MRHDRLPFRFVLFTLAVLVGLSAFSVRTASAYSCIEGGGVNVDLVAMGTVEDIKASQTSYRIEVLVDRVLQGDGSRSGRNLTISSDSVTGGASSVDVGFREGARYMLYLQRNGDEWTTNVCLGTAEIPEESSEDPPTMPETGGPGVSSSVALVGILVFGAGRPSRAGLKVRFGGAH